VDNGAENMKIEGKIFAAVALAAAVKDARYYLNGVHVDNVHIEASNGHMVARLAHNIEVSDWMPQHGVIIPNEVITGLFRGLTAKQKRECVVALDKVDGRVTVSTEGRTMSVDTDHYSNFPDIGRVIPEEPHPRPVESPSTICFHWEYMATFQKIRRVMEGNTKKGFEGVSLETPKESNPMGACRVTFHGMSEFVGAIMPMEIAD
jgi:hypothetical protein